MPRAWRHELTQTVTAKKSLGDAVYLGKHLVLFSDETATTAPSVFTIAEGQLRFSKGGEA
jgi:hypothetical protein